MSLLRCAARPHDVAEEPDSNRYATVEAGAVRTLVALLFVAFSGVIAHGQEVPAGETRMPAATHHENRRSSVVRFLGGALTGLAAHEAGHLALDVAFDADPSLKRVDFHGIPFFAITHRPDLSPRRELAVSSAGFWVQHAGSEWILTRRPAIRDRSSPLLKGILAFNVATSVGYAGAALARTGPHERDTRGIADAAGIDERWVGAMLLAPAVLDAWRYFHPDSRWAAWTSRGAKIGMVLLLARGGVR